MDTSRSSGSKLEDDLRAEVVAFLRDWLPTAAIAEYRRMILADPEGWSEHPHFRGGVIADGALRGNGITEQVLRVADLEDVWPDLLREAVLLSPTDDSTRSG